MEHEEIAEFLLLMLDELELNRSAQAQEKLEGFIAQYFPTIGKDVPYLPMTNMVRTPKKVRAPISFAVEVKEYIPRPGDGGIASMCNIADAIREASAARRELPLRTAPYQKVFICQQDEEDGPIIQKGCLWIYHSWRSMFKNDEARLLLYIQQQKGIVGNKLVYDEVDWVNMPVTGYFKEVEDEKANR